LGGTELAALSRERDRNAASFAAARARIDAARDTQLQVRRAAIVDEEKAGGHCLAAHTKKITAYLVSI
jgi:hypothetical protein